MKLFQIKRNDTSPSLRAVLRNENGSPVHLTSLNEIKFLMRDDFYFEKGKEGVKVEDSQNISLLDQLDECTKGGFEYNWGSSDTDCAGNFYGEFQIVTNGTQSQESETFELANGQTLTVSVDGAADQTVTFLTADFVNIEEATAAEIVTKLNSSLTGAQAVVTSDGKILLQTLTTDLDGSIYVTGGTANPVIRFKVEFVKNKRITLPDQSLKIEVISDLEEN